MAEKLWAYSIGGSAVGRDLDSWETTDLNGNDPFLLSATGATGYIDINTVDCIAAFGAGMYHDYMCQQRAIRYTALDTGWGSLSNTEKDVVSEWFANPDRGEEVENTQAIVHYMTTKGMSLDEAKTQRIDDWHKHFVSFKDACEERWVNAIKVAVHYLSFNDAADLFNTIDKLVEYYVLTGRLGRGYGDSKDGIMNYILSTHGYHENGLEYENYTLTQGTWEQFKADLEVELAAGDWWGDVRDLYFLAPTGLSAIGASSTSIDIEWHSYHTSSGYHIVALTAPGATPSNADFHESIYYDDGTPGTASFSITGLTASTTYDIWVMEETGVEHIVGPISASTI